MLAKCWLQTVQSHRTLREPGYLVIAIRHTYIPGDASDLGCEDVVCRRWVVQRRTTSASLFWGWWLVGITFPQDGLDAGGPGAGTVAGVVQVVLRGIAAPAHLGEPLDV